MFRRFSKSIEKQISTFVGLFNDPRSLSDARQSLLYAVPFWISAVFTGLASVLYAMSFHRVEVLSISFREYAGGYIFAVVPILFLMSWALVEKLAPYSNGSGIPQLMIATNIANSTDKHSQILIEKLLSLRVIIVKFLSSLLLVFAGGAIGREGPTLQIAASIFFLSHHILPQKWFQKNKQGLILAGGAAGLASAFNTPLGGIAYVIEELGKTHLNSFRTGTLHAVIVAGFVSQTVLGPYLYFGYPKLTTVSLDSIPQLILVAIAAALIAALFGQTLKLVVLFRNSRKGLYSRITMTLIAGLLFALLIYTAPKSTPGPGTELLNQLLFKAETASIFDLLARIFGSVLTYASGGAGGVFAPVLSIAGAAGSLFSSFFGADLGALAVIVGMTAGLAAFTQSPLTSFVLILEMTDRHSAIFALMLAAIIGQGVSKTVSKKSFYEFVAELIFERLSIDQPKPSVPNETKQ